MPRTQRRESVQIKPLSDEQKASFIDENENLRAYAERVKKERQCWLDERANKQTDAGSDDDELAWRLY